MKLTTHTSEICFNEKGSVVSYCSHGVEMLAPGGDRRPLFTLRLRDDAGSPVDVDAFSFGKVTCTADGQRLQFTYSEHPTLNIRTTAHICVDDEEDCLRFTVDIENDTDYYVEYLDYPEMTVPDSFAGNGGTGKLFWPAMEGCEVTDPAQRDREMARGYCYHPLSLSQQGLGRFLPWSCPDAVYGLL